jgi:ABC-2 type transport system permease protein
MFSGPRWALTGATLKMWFRDKQALFFTFLLPILFMLLFGVLNFGDFGSVKLALIDQAQNEASKGFITGLKRIESLDIKQGESIDKERDTLNDGKLDMILTLPSEFGAPGQSSKMQVLYNQNRPAETQVGEAILRQALNEITFNITGTQRLFELDLQPVRSKSLRYVDFLMPGIIAMSLMQMGMFSIVFVIVQYKQRGIIRRLEATPLKPSDILFAQVVTRMIVAILVTLVLIGIGVIFFNVTLVGNLGLLLALSLAGAAVFLTMGFAIAGVAKTEEAAAPIANIVVLPQMFLSGIFFSRDVVPGAIQRITDFMPLTYLADSLRMVSVQGDGLSDIWPQILGLGVWMLIMGALASRLFKWE